MKFYSHPDKLILVHLQEVYTLSHIYDNKDCSKAQEILSYTHDFGKYTTFFQEYLFSKNKIRNDSNGHGFISALFGAFIALNFYEEKSLYPIIIYNSILHHHGSLRNVTKNLPGKFNTKKIDNVELRNKIENAFKQIEDMKVNKDYIKEDYKVLGYDKYFETFIEEKPIEKILFTLRKTDFKFNFNGGNDKTYFINQMLYSTLIAADKISAANITLPQVKIECFEKLNKTKNEMFESSAKDRMNSIRNNVFHDVQDEIQKFYKDNKIFSITSPTGTGKTFCGFFAALKLRELLGDNRKIVYALPFTSIINQNYDKIYSLFKDVKNFKNDSSEYIIKHHSLADVEYSSEYENYNKVQSEMLIENWNSGIVVTTFVQLLETLISNKNRMLKKFNALNKSIILLDEVQAIDIKFLKLVDFILTAASKYLDCRVIMMTATRPLILTDAKELLKDNIRYFKEFNRTVIIPKLNKISIDNFIENFYENIEDKSYLIICNTISQSLKIYNEIKNCGRKVLYLSTNILPCFRRQRIDEVNKLLENGEKIILVSTQVVEAGVDFDFDVVIRDIAPMDSIIQAAGRCNRNGIKKEGKVYVISMVDDKERYYGSKVYGHTIINITNELLKDKKSIDEKEYFDLIQEYFGEVDKNKNKDDSEKFRNSITNLYFDESSDEGYSIDKFSLIKENQNYVQVFFRINEEAEETYNKLLKALSTKDMDLKNEMMLEIKNKIQDYTLSIPIKYIDRLNDKKEIVLNLPQSACEIYYDDMTGYKREQDDDFFIM